MYLDKLKKREVKVTGNFGNLGNFENLKKS